jgi:WD40 repeat protein
MSQYRCVGFSVAGLTLLAMVATAGRPDEQKKKRNDQQGPQRADLYGDVLPGRANARLGTVRLRHGAPLISVAVSPDDKTLAPTAADGTLRFWELTAGKQLVSCGVGDGAVGAVRFSADGKALALGSTLSLRDPRTGHPNGASGH